MVRLLYNLDILVVFNLIKSPDSSIYDTFPELQDHISIYINTCIMFTCLSKACVMPS